MRYDQIIDLLTVTYVPDALRQEIEQTTSRSVYANEFYVSEAEYYDAGTTGLRPERLYQIRSCEYEGESLIEVDGVRYEIIRANRRGEWMRLTCQRVLGATTEAVS